MTITVNDDDSHELFNETLAKSNSTSSSQDQERTLAPSACFGERIPAWTVPLGLVEIIHGMVVADDGSKKVHFVDSIDETEDEGKSSSTDLRSLQRMFSDGPCRQRTRKEKCVRRSHHARTHHDQVVLTGTSVDCFRKIPADIMSDVDCSGAARHRSGAMRRKRESRLK